MAPIRAALPIMTRRQTTAAPVPRSIIQTGISTPRTIESIAYAGVDMPVHLVVTRPRVIRHFCIPPRHGSWTTPHSAGSCVKRHPESPPLQFWLHSGAHPTEDKASGCRSWVQIQVQSIIGTPLSLSTLPTAPTQQDPHHRSMSFSTPTPLPIRDLNVARPYIQTFPCPEGFSTFAWRQLSNTLHSPFGTPTSRVQHTGDPSISAALNFTICCFIPMAKPIVPAGQIRGYRAA